MDPHRTTPTSWRAALVAIDVFVGPFPALIPTEHHPQTVLTPRFSLQVAERISRVTVTLAQGSGPVVLVLGKHVALTTIRDGAYQPGTELIAPDGEGRYAISAPFGLWQEVDDLHDDSDYVSFCECGCSAICAACDSSIGAAHERSCPWHTGSAAWELSVIPAARVVLEAHIHRPGCLWVRRRPGPLFLPGDSRCQFCGSLDGCTAHRVTDPDGPAHHQHCRDCRQWWTASAI